MEYKHIQKNVGDSPRKLRLVADMVRKITADQALEILQFTNKAAAQTLLKAIKTAIANAGRKEGLIFKGLEINEGLKMKRYRPGTAGRGRGRPYKKRTSHIRIVLTDEIKGVKSQNSNDNDINKKSKKEGVKEKAVIAGPDVKTESENVSPAESAK